MHVNIEINDLEIAEAVVDSRYFTNAVERVVENMDLGDPVEQILGNMDVPTRDEVEGIVEDMGVPTSDDVYDIAREVVRDEVSNYPPSVSKFLSSSAGKQVLKQGIVDALEDLGITQSLLAAQQTQTRVAALGVQITEIQAALQAVINALDPKPLGTVAGHFARAQVVLRDLAKAIDSTEG